MLGHAHQASACITQTVESVPPGTVEAKGGSTVEPQSALQVSPLGTSSQALHSLHVKVPAVADQSVKACFGLQM